MRTIQARRSPGPIAGLALPEGWSAIRRNPAAQVARIPGIRSEYTPLFLVPEEGLIRLLRKLTLRAARFARRLSAAGAASVQTLFGAPHPRPKKRKMARRGAIFLFYGAGRGIRTPDLLITNQVESCFTLFQEVPTCCFN